jgi:hypothetical protein
MEFFNLDYDSTWNFLRTNLSGYAVEVGDEIIPEIISASMLKDPPEWVLKFVARCNKIILG